MTFEGFVEHDQNRQKDDVYIVPEDGGRPVNLPSARLVHPEQASHFVLEVVDEEPHASL